MILFLLVSRLLDQVSYEISSLSSCSVLHGLFYRVVVNRSLLMHIGRTLIIQTFDKLACDITRHMSRGRKKKKKKKKVMQGAHESRAFGECSVNYSSGFKFPFDSFVQFMGGLRWVRCVVCIVCVARVTRHLSSDRSISRKIESRFLQGRGKFLEVGGPKFTVCIFIEL